MPDLVTARKMLCGLSVLLGCIGGCTKPKAIAAEETRVADYNDSSGTVVRLSTQQTKPFLFLGRPLMAQSKDAAHLAGLAEDYKGSIEKFGSVTDCLDSKERNRDMPDLAKFNWEIIDSLEDADVCLFRVATSYATREDMKKWLELQGFVAQLFNPSRDEQSVSGRWSIKEKGTKFGANFIQEMWTSLIAYELSVVIDYDETGSVTSARATYLIF